jgi:serine protease Do
MDEYNPLGVTPGQDASPDGTADGYDPADEYAPIETSAQEPEPANAPAGMPQAQPYTPPYEQAPYYPQQQVQQPQPVQQPYPPQGQYYPPRPPYCPGPACQPPQPPYPNHPYPQQPYPQAQQPYYPSQPTPPVQPQQPYPQQPYPQTQRPAANPYAAPVQNQPYPPQGQPYAPAPQPPQKPRTSTATKVFLIVLSALLVALVAGFIVYLSGLAKNQNKSNESGVVFPGEEYYEDIFNGNGRNGENQNGQSLETFEEEITLVEDKGETQKHPEDKDATVGKPDEKAALLKLEGLPKDSDDAKYTAQSAYESVGDSVVTVILYKDEITENIYDILGQGTGTIISADGYIVTNAHVIGNTKAYAIKITTNSGDAYQAKVIGYDTWTDLAVLKIDAKGLKPVTFGDSDLIEIGQDVIAIGSPGGERFQNSLTKGIVSAVDRELTINRYVRYIQSDAAISPGNSGGPLCNIYGQVIGINTAKTTATNYEAMTFSIPSRTVKESVDDLIRYGYIRGRARIGFSGSEVSSEEQTYYGLPAGVIVGEIDESGALAGTKLKANDIITAIDDTPVASFQDIYAVLSEHKAGDKVKLSVTRIKED